jgi:hypothetical protein
MLGPTESQALPIGSSAAEFFHACLRYQNQSSHFPNRATGETLGASTREYRGDLSLPTGKSCLAALSPRFEQLRKVMKANGNLEIHLWSFACEEKVTGPPHV